MISLDSKNPKRYQCAMGNCTLSSDDPMSGWYYYHGKRYCGYCRALITQLSQFVKA